MDWSVIYEALRKEFFPDYVRAHGHHQPNFTSDDLKYLVQRQLTTLASWQTELIDVDGKADITSTFTYPEPKHFVWHPYQDSVDRAKAKLQEYLQN